MATLPHIFNVNKQIQSVNGSSGTFEGIEMPLIIRTYDTYYYMDFENVRVAVDSFCDLAPVATFAVFAAVAERIG